MKCFGCGGSAVIDTHQKNGNTRHHCVVCGRSWTTKASAAEPLRADEKPTWWHQ